MIPALIEAKATDPQYQHWIEGVLRARHFGSAKAVTLEVLMLEIHNMTKADRGYENTSRTLRRAMELINQAGGLICSGDDGHFWASSLEEGLGPAGKLKARGLNIVANASALEENLYNAYGGQFRMM